MLFRDLIVLIHPERHTHTGAAPRSFRKETRGVTLALRRTRLQLQYERVSYIATILPQLRVKSGKAKIEGCVLHGVCHLQVGGGGPAPSNFGLTPLKLSQPRTNILAPPLLTPPPY